MTNSEQNTFFGEPLSRLKYLYNLPSDLSSDSHLLNIEVKIATSGLPAPHNPSFVGSDPAI